MLRALTSAGLLRRIQPSGSVARYEARVGDNHHHVVCRSCGAIADVDCAVGETPCLTASDDHGFAIDEAEVIYWGTVPRPARATRTDLTDHQTSTQVRHHDRRWIDVTEHETDGVTAAGQREREPRDRRPHAQGAPPAHEQGLVARPARPLGAAPALAGVEPAGPRLRLRRAVRRPRRRRAQARHRRGDDDLAGLVAGRLRPLRRPVHPDELARGRHLPHRGRPRRRRRRPAALRAAQQLAGQRQPRQGPPPALAGQEEVRPADLVGRPARPRRQRRARGHGLRDLRVRLRPRGRLGARGDLLGSGGRLARRRALQRRPRARRDARCGADGPDLRQPRGPQRRARPAERRPATSARRSPGWR